MKKKCEHFWSYEQTVYDGNTPNESVIRRWCRDCGLIQHSYTTGRWYKTSIGPKKLFGSYPEGYEFDGAKVKDDS